MSTPSPAAFRKIVKELNELKKNPPEGIRVQLNEENMLDFTAMIQGPEETPYAGGYFKIKFSFTSEFPSAPPKCWFTTKIFHPNVSATGEICVNTLKKDWQSSYGISHILVTVKCLLIYPNPESALDEEAGKLLLENYDDYCQRAKLITSVHAKIRPQEFDTPSCSESTSPSTSTKPISAAKSQNTPELNGTPLLSIPSTATPASKTAPTTTQPLQTSPNNVSAIITTTAVASAKDKPRDRHPSPLGTADSNIAANKAVKRSATAGIGAEKRKKALKRL